MLSQYPRLVVSVAALSLVLCATLLQAQEENPVSTSVGTIGYVAENLSEFDLKTGEGDMAKELTLKVDDKTVYMIDDEPATAKQALVVDASATVKHQGNVATEVLVTTKKAEEGEAAGEQ